MRGDAVEQQPELFHGERFGHVVISAAFHRLYRRLNGSVACHHDYFHLRPSRFQLTQDFQAANTVQS
jgi:hypothetical protein